MSDDICGSEDTTSGEPCKFSPGESCPWHNTDDPPEMRKTVLETNAGIIDVVAGEMQNGSLKAEACAEAEISESQYDDWMNRGKENDAKEIFQDFRSEVRRARRIGAKSDRGNLKRQCYEQGDTRTLWKIHKEQYGDLYADTDDADESVDKPIFAVPKELAKEWQQQPTP